MVHTQMLLKLFSTTKSDVGDCDLRGIYGNWDFLAWDWGKWWKTAFFFIADYCLSEDRKTVSEVSSHQ
jgi:hypothetical protein